MNEIGKSLSAQHEHLDRLLALAAQSARSGEWTAYRVRLNALRAALLEHMAYEEEELFPALKGIDTSELVEQHAALREQLDMLGAAAPQYDPEGCIAEIESLASLQDEHHARELEVCYPQSAQASIAPPPDVLAVPEALDLRGLQPPEPIARIFEALERAPCAPLRAILPHEPVPLYGLLRERGFFYTGTRRADGGFEVLIEKA